MRVLVGTSGFSYKQWKGSFYPSEIKEAGMLRFYAERFPSVEINNTFYRMPQTQVLERWADETPGDFSFVLKAPRRITHTKRLGEVSDPVSYFFNAAAALGPKRGPVLFQLPPFLAKDMGRLRAFLGLLPPAPCAALEFRHATWFDDEVYQELRAHGAALCQADTDDAPVAAIVPTARFGYLRLRRLEYGDDELRAWAGRIRAQPWDVAYVFFKHEDEGRGPDLARRLLQVLET